jgi:hypothetical protein
LIHGKGLVLGEVNGLIVVAGNLQRRRAGNEQGQPTYPVPFVQYRFHVVDFYLIIELIAIRWAATAFNRLVTVSSDLRPLRFLHLISILIVREKSPVAKATRRPKNQEKHSNHLRLPLD